MHLEFHVGLPLFPSVHHEFVVGAVVCDSILVDQVAETDDVGDGLRAVPHFRRVAAKCCLVGDSHIPTIALHREFVGRLCDALHQPGVEEQVSSWTGCPAG